jgi:dehydrogenase/reductase SDR family protein 7B
VNEFNIKVTNVSPGYVNTDVDRNSVNASGQRYDKEDTNVTQGASSMDMANSILRAILNDEKDPVICSFKVRVAVWLRFICPPIYFMIMNQRALTHKHEI